MIKPQAGLCDSVRSLNWKTSFSCVRVESCTQGEITSIAGQQHTDPRLSSDLEISCQLCTFPRCWHATEQVMTYTRQQ